MNIIILVGFIASMLGLQVSHTGAKYLRFDLAVKNSAANNNSTTFVKCVAFGKTAEFIATFFKVGSPIGVIAEVRNNNYTDANDVKHYSYEFCVWKASFVGRKVDNPAAVVAGTVAQPSAQPVQTASVAGGQSFQPVPGSTHASMPTSCNTHVAAGGGIQQYAQPVQTASIAGGQSFQPVPGSTQASMPTSCNTQVAAGGGIQQYAQPVQTASVAGEQSYQPVPGSTHASMPTSSSPQVAAGGGIQPSAQPVQTASVTERSSFPLAPGSTQATTPISGATQVAAGGCAQSPAGSATPNTLEQGIKLRKMNDIYTQDEMKIVDSNEFADE